MKTTTLACLFLLMLAPGALALSVELHDPNIFFPKSYDRNKAELITAVLSDKTFKFKEGLTSYWEPRFETTLAYNGDTAALNAMIARLSLIKGIHVAVSFSDDLSKETHGFPPSANWWVSYEHTHPDTLTLRVNLASKQMDRAQVKLPPDHKQ
jgi:hypothetical protein